jgi:3-oxoacyl-[acyl-carrier-protein] synthase III
MPIQRSTIVEESTAPRGATITGIGAHRPANRVDNELIAERLGSSDEWIKSRSGIATRGIATLDETVVTMAASAGQRALDAAHLAPTDIGLIIVASCTLTEAGPPAAQDVARILGTASAGVMDIGAACAGFTYGLSVAADSIRSGSSNHVLVIGSEKFSDIIDPDDRSTAFLFGDGAGAAVVSLNETDTISPPVWLSDGAQADVLKTVGSPPILVMDGGAVYRWAIAVVPSLAQAVCDRAGIALTDLDAIVPHQANLRIIDNMARALDLPEDFIIGRDIVDSGNTSAASIPLAMSRMIDEGELHCGDLVLLVGFGAGLTAAGQIVRCP